MLDAPGRGNVQIIMKIIDLSLPIRSGPSAEDTGRLGLDQSAQIDTREVRLSIADGSFYTARVHRFAFGGMYGTYVDFPSHVARTDDGSDAATVDPARLFRVPATVVHLDRASGSGGISAGEIESAAPAGGPREALIINALGARRFDTIDPRSVHLTMDAVRWIIDRGVRLLISDVYERATQPEGVFVQLFTAGIFTVCNAVDLHRLTAPAVRVTVLPLPIAGATQAPCRVIAEIQDIAPPPIP
jgi:kynurenine formamidase